MAIQRHKLLDRGVQHRDAWICVLVTEDSVRTPRYFEDLRDRRVIDPGRVRVEVVPTLPETQASAPSHVCDRAQLYRQKYDLQLGMDQIWLVVDVDCWGGKQLGPTLARARQLGYGFAASHPCFETWLLLHLTEQIADLQTAEAAKARLGAALDAHHAVSKEPPYRAESIRLAISRAAALEQAATQSGWPLQPGTQVHHILTALLR